MKKGFLAMAFFGIMSSCFCQEIYYEVKADTVLFKDDGHSLFKIDVQEQRDMIRMMNKGEKVKYTFGDNYSIGDLEEGDPLSFIVATDQNGIKGKVAWADLFLSSNDFLPDDIKTNNIEKERWISAYCYEILSSNAKETIFQYESYWKNEWYSSVGEAWHEDISPSNFMIFDNAIDMMGYDSSGGIFLITSLEKVKDGIKIGLFIEYEIVSSSKDIFLHHFNKGEQEITLKIDGDYLEMYLDGSMSPLMIFARTNDYWGITEKLRAIARGEKADLRDVTWPRHADGSCDYDDIAPAAANETTDIEESENTHATERTESVEEAAFPETILFKPAPVMGKTATVTENLRLRSDYDTTAEVVATLAAGTRVQVHLLGKEDTIDGITSNWVWVETPVGAKDKDGNAVAAGTKGWLFGGYLSEAADADAPAKQNTALPILPIAAGGAALAVLLAVVLLAVKKRKSGKK